MRAFDVDGACEYMQQATSGRKPSRKTVYNMVAQGMKVARLGETGRRMVFTAEWIDAFLESKASTGRAVR